MSLKDLFKEQDNLKSAEPLTKEDFKYEIESFDYAEAINKRNARFIATEGFDDPSNFARFGLAEKYYEDAITRIHDSYPYDGSLKEKVLWEVSSSLIDLYILENGYPRSTGYANFIVSADTSGEEGDYFYPPVSDEYVLIKGGPHEGTGDKLYYDQVADEVVYRKDANIYDLENNRESNLLIDGTKGNTVEFWLKKDVFVANQEYFEFVLDTHVTGTTEGDAGYGRLAIALATTGTTDNSSNQPIYVSYASGSDVIRTYLGSSTLTTASIADGDWHHYAIRMKTSGSDTIFDLFVDGEHNDTTTELSTTVGYVSGAIVATLGSQVAPFNDGDGGGDYGDRGWSPFSGSIDEFRYWKRWRTSKQIQTRWFDQVGGGTNTDLSNTDLGVYFKFNEGITQTASVDSTVLDYSGRISNGAWTGYNSTLSRDTGSAILESSASLIEFRDPIIYSFHPDVATFNVNMKASGSIYDDSNVNSLKSYFPAWMLDQNETDRDQLSGNYLLNLLQIISSYFDEASILLKKLPQLSHAKYYKGSGSPPPFNKKALESAGFMVPDIFVDATLLEKFENRDDELKFEKDIQEVKNTIYQNIYNNLTYLYKTKGTEKSIRNLLRCFGIGDNVLKINLYGNEAVYKLEDNLKSVSRINKYINFNEKQPDDSNDAATIYQYKIDDNSTSFISGTSEIDGTFEGAGLSFTLESNVILPNRVPISEYGVVKKNYDDIIANFYPLHITSSLFGMHTANGVENNLTWAANDYANFQVTTVKDDLYSSNAYFRLTGTADGFMPELTSSVFENVYDDQLWTISVTVEPSKIESINQVSGTGDSDYTIRFYGVSHIADYKANEFLVTGTISNDAGRKILSSPKRVFVGAHRLNFTERVLENTDVKVNSCKAWFASIPTGTIDSHNLKLGNYGAEKPTQNTFLYQDSINDKFVPESQTLALLWNFSTVTASNASGEFSVEDETSGSADDNRYGWFSDLVSRRHTASGSFFIDSSTSVVESLERSTYQPQVPEVLTDSNLTRILSEDDEYFDRNTRPTTYHLSVEKNLFQDISEEMLNMFGSVVWFNNMIGSPENAYRGEYKELKRAANLFFEKVGNDYDFDKYVEYFKFIDYSVSRYLVKLIPASMLTFKDGISTIIENFALGDRNKFRNKFPLIKNIPIDISGTIDKGYSVFYLQNKAPHGGLASQGESCRWWLTRAERDGILTSGDSAVDADKEQIRQVINDLTNVSAPTLRSGSTNYQGSALVFSRTSQRPYNIEAEKTIQYHGGGNGYENKKVGFWDSIRKNPTPSGSTEGGLISIEPTESDLEQFKDCSDDLELNRGKREYSFSIGTSIEGEAEFSEVYKGQMVFPFSLYSSSVTDNPAMSDLADFQANLAITNLHHDNYGDFGDVPAQGPFTEKFVGGRPYRHVMTNFTPDNATPDGEGERLEGWRLTASADSLDLVNPNSPKSVYFREEYAKRPVNIKNIKQLTSSADTDDQATDASGVTRIGNYTEVYEVIMTNGRTLNNRYLAESDGDLPTTTTDSTFISGVVDFAIPRRDLTGSNKAIIVNRFSAPGDPSTMAEGMLDVAAGEYSVYNALPFRNLNVRLPLQELYANHTNQFGYFSDQFNVSAYELAGVSYPGGSSSVNTEDYSGTGSFHKVNRNGRQAIRFSGSTGYSDDSYEQKVKYDNWHHQHAIPQTDVQYAWITASLIENYTGSALYGYENKGLDKGDFASSDLVFASASDFGSFTLYDDGVSTNSISQSSYVITDFVGINSNIYEPVSSSTNTLGYEEFGSPVVALRLASNQNRYFGLDKSIFGSDAFNNLASGGGFIFGDPVAAVNYINTDFITDAAPPRGIPQIAVAGTLNSILLHRNGLFGGANWKLYRKDNHPIVRYQKNHNQIGYSVSERSEGGTSLKFLKDVRIKNFTEPPITSKYKPLRFSFKEASQEQRTNALLSLGNVRAHFTDHTAESALSDEFSVRHLDSLLPVGTDKQKIQKLTYNSYAAFKNYLDSKNLTSATEVVYAETIYPKALYTYLSGTRKRINFTNDFWRDARDNRADYDLNNSMGETIETSSIWKLDAHIGFTENSQSIPYSGGMTQQDGVGELQNCYSLFHYGTASDITPGVNYNRRIKLLHQNAGELPDRGAPFYVAREDLTTAARNLTEFSFSGLTDSPDPALFSASAGDTLWEASSSDNYKPFYDSYDDYAEEGFRNLKDGTILPEFRISEKINDYISANVEMNYNNYNPNGFFTAFLNQNGSSNLKIETGLLSLTGGATHNTTEEFLNRYAFSDFYDYFQLVEEDYEDKTVKNDPTALMTTSQNKIAGTTHKLSCEAILKFLPYDGFYPSERATQLGTLFSESIARTTTLEGTDANFRTLMQPFFAPGILFNSIKSGIAVDYPIRNSVGALGIEESVVWGDVTGRDFNARLKLSELIEPQVNTIIDADYDADLALNSTASYRFTSTPKHTFAISNFLAETVNLFIGRQSSEQSMIIQAGESALDQTIVIPRSGTYSFDLHLINSTNIIDYSSFSTATSSMVAAPFSSSTNPNQTLSSSLQINTSSITMYNRAITGYNIDPFLYGSSFGPPQHSGEFTEFNGTQYVGSNLHGTAFDPFTPPYYNGFSTVRISLDLDPLDYDGGVVTREEIFASASFTYDRLRTFFYPNKGSGSVAEDTARQTINFKQSMQLSASMFLGDENPDQVLYEREARVNPDLETSDVETRQVIAFKPRWECPVLDFTNADPTESFVSGNVAKGMWHQYGEIPAAGDGVFMKLEPGTNAGNLDLLQLLNINSTQTSKVGKINAGITESPTQVAATFSKLTKKEFSEAIIAIPFKYNKTTNETELYPIDKFQTDLLKDNIYRDPAVRFDAQHPNNIRRFDEVRRRLSPTNTDANPLLENSKDLYDLMLLMRKYVIPPHLDFLHNDNIDPFVMFMMEYSIDLTQKDLQNIWQNVEPTFSRRALKVTSESNMHLMPTTDQMFNSHDIFFKKTLFDPETTRWAVFKVKRRAAANYNSVAGKIIHNNHEYIRKDLKGKTDDFLYSYNWPHDFFSLIELAKINSITTFNPNYKREEDE